MELAVLDIAGKDTGKKVELKESIFNIEPNEHAIYLDVKQYLANNRQGTHKSKERNEVAGSTRKLKRQKGTGTARAGSIKSPVFRGGGTMFGPRPRNYRFKLNRKLKQLARRSALTLKAQQGSIILLSNVEFQEVKTKKMVELKQNLNIADKKSLLILSEPNKNVYLSSRNLPGSLVLTYSELTTYDIMNANSILFDESALQKLQENL
jgi:large subunit ribosomal protein L4